MTTFKNDVKNNTCTQAEGTDHCCEKAGNFASLELMMMKHKILV